jgi:hypothetical protein
VFSLLLQVAQGLGMSDSAKREQMVAAGMTPLTELVGQDSANEALMKLKEWSRQLSVPSTLLTQDPWSMLEQQQKSETLLKETAQADPVMSLARRLLHKYNGHSKFALGAAKVINITLAVASSTPTLLAPAASVLQFVYQMSTGGPEDWKLLQEVYLDKRIDSRWRRLNQETTQAVSAYNNAVMTHNPVLLGLSECFVSALGGEEASSKIIGEHRLVAGKTAHDDSIDCVQTHNMM